ncbi:hypothetical protein K431DRAFT_287604 [Polychaeton citri CBS 116435]|uniref:RING-CH-type domain-containing protein n=1 Tax=Polychaeton citri CBS 116435 TaxID=1314669 RepID=A0A9P4Q320_9PEZI|nr:hypothetical protein K431DRAFT_287604 [Polychaeton citri CBS 116435]
MAGFSTGSSWSFPDDLNAPSKGDAYATNQQPEDTARHRDNVNNTSTRYNSPWDDSTQFSSREDNDVHGEGQSRQNDGTDRFWRPRTCRICLESVLPTFDTPSAALPSWLAGRPHVTYASPPEDGGRLIRPCKCKGSQKYVHEGCLDLWRRQDPEQKRNWYQCPTCSYQYRLQRLSWGRSLESTVTQLSLTFAILAVAMFGLGFVADPIINFYLDPYDTLASAGGPAGSLVYDGEAAGWAEHFAKGLTSLGLLGFAKFLLSVSPWHWWNMRGSGLMGGSSASRSGISGTGRDRVRDLSWIAVLIGIITFLWAVWKGVRAWSRRTLERARQKVMDVTGDDNDEDESDAEDD